MDRTTRTFALPAAALLAAVPLAACGSSDATTGSAGSTAGCTAGSTASSTASSTAMGSMPGMDHGSTPMPRTSSDRLRTTPPTSRSRRR